MTLSNGFAKRFSLNGRHDAGGDIIVEGEDGDRRLANGKGRRGHHRRQQPLEALSRLRQLGRNPRTCRMNLGADVMGNEPHDALAVGCGEALAGIRQATRQPIDPEPAIGIEHHLDDDRVFEPGRDRRSKRGAQHACTTRYHLGL